MHNFSTFKKRTHQKGLTLIELLVVIMIIGLMALMAAPNYARMVEKSKLREAMHEWQNSFHFAQAEAMRTQRKIEMCVSSNGETCDAGNTGNFNVGWIVIRPDLRVVGRAQPPVLRDIAAIDERNLNMFLQSYTGNGAGAAFTPVNRIVFLGTGRIQVNGATVARNLALSVNTKPNHRVLNEKDGLCLLISSEGRMKSANTTRALDEKALCKTH